MAEERHTTAFVVGAILGGFAGAAATLWKVPRSGEKTRALIAERVEGVLFRLTRMNEWQQGDITSQPSTASESPAEIIPASEEASRLAAEDVSIERESADDGATLPLTFRGEILTEPAASEVGAQSGEGER